MAVVRAIIPRRTRAEDGLSWQMLQPPISSATDASSFRILLIDVFPLGGKRASVIVPMLVGTLDMCEETRYPE